MSTNNESTSSHIYFNRPSYSNPVYVNESMIAFLDDTTGTPQLAHLDLQTGESRRITDYSEGVMSLLASGSTGTVIFGIDQNGDERQQLYTMGAELRNPHRLTHDDAAFFEPGAISPDGSRVIYRTNTRDQSIFDIAVSAVDGSDTKIVLQDGGQVLPQDITDVGALVIQSRSNTADALLLISPDGNVRNLVENQTPHRIYKAVFDVGQAAVWMLSELDREFVALHKIDLDSGEIQIAYQADWDVEHLALSPDGAWLVLSINENGYSRPFFASTEDPQSAKEIELPGGVVDGFSWNPDSGEVVFGHSTSENPSSVYRATLSGEIHHIIGTNGGDVSTVAAQPVSFTTWDGRQVPAYLYMPETEGPHAALVEIHGGPEGQRRPGYGSTGASIQHLVSLGIAVLALNIRGSTGYGREYQHLDDKEKRLDALKDVEEAARWLGNREDIDASRIAVFGISYGGYMTLSAVTRLPNVWAAAAEMVGMAHLETFLERTGAWRRKHREGEYGSLETDREMLRAVSPLPLVDQIAVPLLVFHGKNDARVPLFESEQIVEAVSNRGLDVELIVYDDEGHVFNKRKNLIDAYDRIGRFLTKHFYA